MIKIDNISLECFYKERHEYILKEFIGESKSDMIHQIDERLINSRKTEQFESNNAYLISINDYIVGYIYTSGNLKNYIYLECSLLKQHRNKGLGSYILNCLTDYIFENNPQLREIRLNIDRSNFPSMSIALKNDFINEEDYMSEKIDFIKNNPYYKKLTKY